MALVSMRAASSSSRGILTVLLGANRSFEKTRSTLHVFPIICTWVNSSDLPLSYSIFLCPLRIICHSKKVSYSKAHVEITFLVALKDKINLVGHTLMLSVLALVAWIYLMYGKTDILYCYW